MVYLTESQAELWLGDLLLTGDTVDETGHSYTIDALAEDATWDNPIPVDVSVQRWMADGAVASTQGHENREPYFKIRVTAGTSAGLAAAEAALVARAGKPCALSWTPPEGAPDAAVSVFEVWTWHLEHIFDGLAERRLERTYGVRMTAKPWVRSAELTQADAPVTSTSPTFVPIDDCSSATNWTGFEFGPTVSGGALVETNVITKADMGGASQVTGAVNLTRSGTVTGLGSMSYLLVDSTTTGGSSPEFLVYLDSIRLIKAATFGTTSVWELPTGMTSFSTMAISYLAFVRRPSTLTMTIRDISATDTLGGVGSHRQLLRSVEVGGSVKTSGSIQVASPDATPLGTVLVYTSPDDGSGYVPSLRQLRTSGNTVSADGSAVSGNHEALVTSGTPNGPITYAVPVETLTEGTYAVVGRFQATTTGALTVTVTASLPGSATQTIVGTVTFTAANTWTWGTLGSLVLPPGVVPAGSGLNVTVTLAATHAATATLDEVYLLDLTRGDVSLVNAGTATILWLDAPDADPARNRPAVYAGTLDDRSDAVGVQAASILSLGDHDLDPAGAVLFSVTDNVADAGVAVSFYQRWHTHAGA